MKRQKIMCCIILSLCQNLVYAKTTNDINNVDISVGSIVHMTLMLLAILILIFIIAYFLRKMVFLRGNINGALKVINTIPIGTKERLILLKAHDNVMLLGVTANSINTLHVFDSDDIDLEKVKDVKKKRD